MGRWRSHRIQLLILWGWRGGWREIRVSIGDPQKIPNLKGGGLRS